MTRSLWLVGGLCMLLVLMSGCRSNKATETDDRPAGAGVATPAPPPPPPGGGAVAPTTNTGTQIPPPPADRPSVEVPADATGNPAVGGKKALEDSGRGPAEIDMEMRPPD